MSTENHSVSKAQWAKLSLGMILVLLSVAGILLSGAFTNQGTGSVNTNPNIASLERKAQSNQYRFTIYNDGSSIYVSDYAIGNITKLVTSNLMDAAATINDVLTKLSSQSGLLTQVLMVQLKGSFIINTPVLVPSWCILDLRLATLILANATDKDMVTNTHRYLGDQMIGVIGGVLDGNKAGQTGGSRAQPASAIIHFWNTHEILISGVQLKNAKWENLLLSICYDALIKNVDSRGAGYMGIATEFGTHDVLITNCKTYNNEVNGILIAWNNVTVVLNATIQLPDGYNTIVSNCEAYNNGVYGVSIEGYSATRNITVTNSSILGNVFAGVHIGTGSSLLITKSNISGNGFGLRVTVGEQDPVATAPVNGLTISYNTISNKNGGIFLIGSVANWIQNVTITQNQFSGNSTMYSQYASYILN